MAKRRILVVEDDELFAEYLSVALAEEGYDVLGPVTTGEDAVARTRAEGPDLILMDVNLPGELDGIMSAEHIGSFSDVPVIYLTGHSEDLLFEKAKITHPYGYLVKPVSKRELVAAMEMALSLIDSS